MPFNRRQFLTAAGGALLASRGWPLAAGIPGDAIETRLRLAPGRVQVAPDDYRPTDAWTFNGSVPGPELRFRQGQRVRLVVDNGLADDTSVHWHGLRVPNAMDGVAHVTQPPIAPGQQYVYEFDLPDAGTYWYHPHHAGHEQVARGLYGALVVEEREPIAVDRDLVWVLSDWRLDAEAAPIDDFGNLHDMTHAGRIGNVVALNGKFTDARQAFEVRGGERLRLRLVNAATARGFALRFNGHAPSVIALDGQPVTPHEAAEGRVVLAPGQRVDLVLDCIHAAGARFELLEDYYPRQPGTLLSIVYTDAPPRRSRPPETPIALPPNRLAEPDLARAETREVLFAGGAMGRLAAATVDGRETDIRTMVREHGLAWAINGVAARHGSHPRLFDLERNGHYRLVLANDSAWEHPIHLHGHSFRVLSIDGAPPAHLPWRDTVTLPPGGKAEIAFVADNPGEWMFHCHIFAHQAGGMSGTVRVAG